jgi:limonene-1,2-epoxide hydrolase
MTDPSPQAHDLASGGAPTAVVRRFLDLLAEGRIDDACDLLADDVRYVNVPLPPIRGRDRVRAALNKAMTRLPGAGFEVYLHAVSANGPVVLTERTDVLKAGRVRVQFWVCGRFDVHDERITLWRDYFDWGTFLVATVRGLLAAVLPILRPAPPGEQVRAA